MKNSWLLFLAVTFLLGTTATAKEALANDPEEAWKQVEDAAKPPAYPPEWNNKAPTEEQKETFQKMLGEKSLAAASLAQEFHTRFPSHAKAGEAKEKERRFVQQALNFGATELPANLESTLSEEERIAQKLNQVNRRALAKQQEGMGAVMKEYESGLRNVMKEHPKNASLWPQMFLVVQNSEDKEHAKKVLEEIAASEVADAETKDRAKSMMRAYGAAGRPLEISFAATDGSQVDVQKMKGKVVLLDFWASWCGPCIASFPEVIELYQTYHAKGLEILGINMDKDRKAMDAAIEKFEIPWRQYFDGRGWANRYAMEFGVSAIPSMWLVDKKGVLRTMEARENLEQQVKDLLAESDPL